MDRRVERFTSDPENDPLSCLIPATETIKKYTISALIRESNIIAYYWVYLAVVSSGNHFLS
jgi:hypothetical protein